MACRRSAARPLLLGSPGQAPSAAGPPAAGPSSPCTSAAVEWGSQSLLGRCTRFHKASPPARLCITWRTRSLVSGSCHELCLSTVGKVDLICFSEAPAAGSSTRPPRSGRAAPAWRRPRRGRPAAHTAPVLWQARRTPATPLSKLLSSRWTDAAFLRKMPILWGASCPSMPQMVAGRPMLLRACSVQTHFKTRLAPAAYFLWCVLQVGMPHHCKLQSWPRCMYAIAMQMPASCFPMSRSHLL
mmetsp:Transcript_116819/g.342062  ORF Transcript_116819/g.342062 Transcript_116819/m.342062 type:complete len:242 (-) Transcript_116819:797-1522(-)